MIALADAKALHSADSVARRRMFLATGLCVSPGLAEEPVPEASWRDGARAVSRQHRDVLRSIPAAEREAVAIAQVPRDSSETSMGRVELFPFRFRDPVTGKWTRARYKAERHEIAERYADYEIIGPPEIRDGDPDSPRFTPHVGQRADGTSQHVDASEPELRPYLAMPPAIDVAEAILVKLFLRRYITYCARRKRFAAMNGAARLFAELTETRATGRATPGTRRAPPR